MFHVLQSFFRLVNLRKLLMSDNEIDSVPADISNFINLEELDISKNGKLQLRRSWLILHSNCVVSLFCVGLSDHM